MGAHVLGVGEHGVGVGVGVLAERLGLLRGLGAHRGGVLLGGDPQLLGGPDGLELLLAHRDGGDGEQPEGHRPGRGDASVSLEPGLQAQPLGLGAGPGQLLGGGGAVALGGLGGLADDAVALGLRGLQQHPDLLAGIGDRLACLLRGVGEPGLGHGERAGRGVVVGGGLVVEAACLGLEHLGQRGRLGGLLLGLAAQLVGHLLGMEQQLGGSGSVRRLRGRRLHGRLRGRLGARVWVDRLHSVHQVLVQPTLPPTGSVPRRLTYPRSILRQGPGGVIRRDHGAALGRTGDRPTDEGRPRTSRDRPRVETLAGVPRPLTGVAGLCATLLIAVAGGAAVPPTVAHGAAGPVVERPATRDGHASACARADGVGTDPRRGTPRPRARRADDAGAAGRSGGRGRLPRDRIAGPAGAAAAPRRRRPGRREHHLERADPGRQRVGATSGPGPWLPGVHRGRPGGRHGRAGARRSDPVPGVHVCRCGARPRTDRPRGGRGRAGRCAAWGSPRCWLPWRT